MQVQQQCFCKTELMSHCVADDREQQRHCHFYQPASAGSKCMYFVSEEFCDCLNAQVDAQKGIG